jgi:hypothetical protein
MCVFSCHYICLTPVHFNAKMTGSEITWKLFHRFLAAGGRTRVKSGTCTNSGTQPKCCAWKKKEKISLANLKGFLWGRKSLHSCAPWSAFDIFIGPSGAEPMARRVLLDTCKNKNNAIWWVLCMCMKWIWPACCTKSDGSSQPAECGSSRNSIVLMRFYVLFPARTRQTFATKNI